MFKSARWRSEKEKIKAVFKLQFRATQVAGEALLISVVPADVGKPTLKLEKATVQGDGSCCWENSVYETVKLIRDPKSGKIHEKIYNFVVGTGSSKSGVVGEASIDFSSYAEATKVSSVSLPLKNSKSGAVLHVSILRIHDSFNQSIIHENETAKPDIEDKTLKAQLNEDIDASFEDNPVDETQVNKNVSILGTPNARRASSESDITLTSSESSYGLDTPQEFQVKNRNNTSKVKSNLLSSPNDALLLQTRTIEESQSSEWEWLAGSTLDGSTDKSDIVALARRAEVSELELQTLRKQIVKESKRSHDLSREIANVKEERDAFKAECDRLKASQRRLDDAKSKDGLLDRGDVQTLVQELRQELNYQKDLNANLQIQLEKTQDSNSELILAVRDLDELLEQKNKEKPDVSDDEDDDDDEQKELEQLVRQHSDVKEAYLLERTITDLKNEREIYRRDKDELEMQMEQLALDYEILKQENHDLAYKLEQSQLQEQLKMQYECSGSYAMANELEAQIEGLENELMKQSKEFSDSLLTITSLEAQVKSLEEELEKQAQRFEADLEALSHAKVEQEQRAIRAEEALRKTRWQNANAAERLQEEFARLSAQMTSTFQANEKLAAKALTEAKELQVQKADLEEMLQKSSEELESVREHYETRLLELESEKNLAEETLLEKNKILTDHANKSECLRKTAAEMLQKSSEELQSVREHYETMLHELENEKNRAEETLLEKNNILSEHASKSKSLMNELEEMRKTAAEMELMLEHSNKERSDLENRLALMHEKVEEYLKEMGTLRAQYNELNARLSEDELEKDKLRKQVSQLKGDLKKKEEALNSIDKRLMFANGTRAAASRNNKLGLASQGLKEVASLKEKIKLLEGQIKGKENALETSTNSFMEKEKDLQDKIEELETRLEELNQNTATLCEQKSQKVATEDIDLNCGTSETVNRGTGDSDKLLKEVTVLRERNSLMEDELKEMQERYSEISLRFAEVEGERQQLVMKVRNLKNAKRSP